ncbi:MAG: urease accessory protein UreF, partial [Alphaproteobacteria bacterium]
MGNTDFLETDVSRDYVVLSTWLSPAFPIGSFSYSHGLETAIVAGVIKDATTLHDWIGMTLEHGSGWCDAVFLAEAWRAGSAEDLGGLAKVAETAIAMAPAAERLLETRGLGAAFLEAVSAGWPHALLGQLAAIDPSPAYPIAVGAAAAAHNIPIDLTLAGFLYGFAANLISVAVRLVPLGQSNGLFVLSQLQPLILEMASRANHSSLDDLGSAAILSDFAAMRHETLQSRVF